MSDHRVPHEENIVRLNLLLEVEQEEFGVGELIWPGSPAIGTVPATLLAYSGMSKSTSVER